MFHRGDRTCGRVHPPIGDIKTSGCALPKSSFSLRLLFPSLFPSSCARTRSSLYFPHFQATFSLSFSFTILHHGQLLHIPRPRSLCDRCERSAAREADCADDLCLHPEVGGCLCAYSLSLPGSHTLTLNGRVTERSWWRGPVQQHLRYCLLHPARRCRALRPAELGGRHDHPRQDAEQ